MTRAVHTVFLLLVALSLLAAGPTIDRDDLIVSVRAPKTVIPGQFETFILELSNDYDFDLHFKVTVDKPRSWRFLSPVEEVHLAPGETRNIIFLLDIDRACEIGQKTIRFEFFDEEHDVRIVESVVTSVENIHQLEARAIRHPKHLMSGQAFEVEFIVRNLGNCYEDVKVSSESGTPNISEILLPPNSTYHVKVTQQAPKVSHVGFVGTNIVLETDSSMKPLRERVSLKIYPKITKRTDPFQRFPVDVSLIYYGAQTNKPYEGGFQYEVEGQGHLDRSGYHHLYIKSRGPNRFNIARVGNFDQYTAVYTLQRNRFPITRVLLGDYAYNLTPLTEMYRWARGAGVSQEYEKFEFGAFYNQPRFIPEIRDQFAGWGKFKLQPNWSIQLNGMNRNYVNGQNAQLASLRTELKIKNHEIKAEYGVGAVAGETGTGANFELAGGIEKLGISYSTQNIYASQYFPGYFTNSLFSNSNIRYRSGRFMLNAGYSYNDANPSQDTILSAAPYSTTAMFGATYFVRKGLRINVALLNRAKEDRFTPKRFSYRENAVRYIMTYNDKLWNIRLDGEFAQTQNLLTNSDNFSTTYNIRGRADRFLTRGWAIGGFTQYLYTNRYTADRQRYLLYGVNATLRPMSKVSLVASLRNNYLIEEYTNDRSLLDLQLRARHKNHQLLVGVSHALIRNTVDRKDFFINARYTVRINTPLRKKVGLYSLTGTIKASNPRDAQGVIVRLAGQSVMTDDYGRFEFNDLPVGIHYLHIDMGTLDIGLTTSVETPLEVEIMPKDRNYISIDLLRAGTIEGKIEFKMPPREMPSGEMGYPLRVVKATMGERELLTYTDDQGNYSFKQVLPGEWTVRVVENTPNDNVWTVTENNKRVNIGPARKEQVDFEIKKRERKIQFKSQQSIDLKIKKE
jgi:hypothetical protein